MLENETCLNKTKQTKTHHTEQRENQESILASIPGTRLEMIIKLGKLYLGFLYLWNLLLRNVLWSLSISIMLTGKPQNLFYLLFCWFVSSIWGQQDRIAEGIKAHSQPWAWWQHVCGICTDWPGSGMITFNARSHCGSQGWAVCTEAPTELPGNGLCSSVTTDALIGKSYPVMFLVWFHNTILPNLFLIF